MAVYRLEKDNIWFPNPENAENDGLLAVGGDLSAERLLLAYQNGIFPWYNPGQEILWWCPKDRFVIIPEEIHISRSMKKYLRQCSSPKRQKITFNKDFSRVMHRCRTVREAKEGSWITDEMEIAYGTLHHLGYAVSVEVYEEETLIGGLYGVSTGKCFFGESMFSDQENASKLALIMLAKELETRGFRFIDCQFHTEHLERMGGKYISYQHYMNLIKMG